MLSRRRKCAHSSSARCLELCVFPNKIAAFPLLRRLDCRLPGRRGALGGQRQGAGTGRRRCPHLPARPSAAPPAHWQRGCCWRLARRRRAAGCAPWRCRRRRLCAACQGGGERRGVGRGSAREGGGQGGVARCASAAAAPRRRPPASGRLRCLCWRLRWRCRHWRCVCCKGGLGAGSLANAGAGWGRPAKGRGGCAPSSASVSDQGAARGASGSWRSSVCSSCGRGRRCSSSSALGAPGRRHAPAGCRGRPSRFSGRRRRGRCIAAGSGAGRRCCRRCRLWRCAAGSAPGRRRALARGCCRCVAAAARRGRLAGRRASRWRWQGRWRGRWRCAASGAVARRGVKGGALLRRGQAARGLSEQRSSAKVGAAAAAATGGASGRQPCRDGRGQGRQGRGNVARGCRDGEG
jgi:hypothetical protein